MTPHRLKRADFKLAMLLGLGKTAQVYLAYAPDGREVALKLPRKEVRTNPRQSRMFAQEVLLSLGLTHPNLVHGLAGKPYGEDAFLALEYFPEGSLQHRLAQGPLDPEAALRYTQQIAQALIYLHGRGIVHQDVKPANVFLAGSTVKLGDFGVAKTPNDTNPLERAGSPYYMAPELFKGEAATPASDAYSLGVLAYELFAGRRPFEYESYDALMTAHLTKPPPPLTGVERPIAQAILGLLAKNPSDRPSLTEFVRVLKGEPPPPAPKTERATTPRPSLLSRLFRRKP